MLLSAWALLLAVDVGLRFLPFSVVWRATQQAKRVEGKADNPEVTVKRWYWLVAKAAELHVWPMTCLRRSLVLQILLARQGIPTDLRFGVWNKGSQREAHAWLLHGGQPVGQPQAMLDILVPLTLWNAD